MAKVGLAKVSFDLGIVLKIRGTRLGLLSGYAPHQSSADADIIREQFFQDGEDLLDNMSDVDNFLVTGDFNSHLSKNANEEFGIAGSSEHEKSVLDGEIHGFAVAQHCGQAFCL